MKVLRRSAAASTFIQKMRARGRVFLTPGKPEHCVVSGRRGGTRRVSLGNQFKAKA